MKKEPTDGTPTQVYVKQPLVGVVHVVLWTVFWYQMW